MVEFKNKNVLITGASRGIGYDIAKEFLLNGANIIICSQNQKKIKNAFKKLDILKKDYQKIFYKQVDISSTNQIKKFIKSSIKKFKRIDILVNNAGIYGPKGEIENVNWSKWISNRS